MKKTLTIIAAAIAIAGCSGKQETPTTETIPEQTWASGTTDASAVQSANEAAGNPELEAAIRATDPNYSIDAIGTGDGSQNARYATGRSDLNGDGNPEVFVYLMGPYFCGSGGCNLLVFSQGMDGYKLLANIPTSDPPVILAESSTNGFKDFWRMQAGGGAPPEFVKHTFENGKYIEKSRQHGNEKPSGIEVLSEGIDFASGIELEPEKH